MVVSGGFQAEDDGNTRKSGLLALEAALALEKGLMFMVEGGEEAPLRMTKEILLKIHLVNTGRRLNTGAYSSSPFLPLALCVALPH